MFILFHHFCFRKTRLLPNARPMKSAVTAGYGWSKPSTQPGKQMRCLQIESEPYSLAAQLRNWRSGRLWSGERWLGLDGLTAGFIAVSKPLHILKHMKE